MNSKKYKIIPSILAVIILLIGISSYLFSNKNEERIKISKHSDLTLKYVSENVKEIKKILESIHYVEENLDLDNEDFKLWVEMKSSKQVISSYAIWIKGDASLVIFNKNTNKYGYINDNNALSLKKILIQYTEK